MNVSLDLVLKKSECAVSVTWHWRVGAEIMCHGYIRRRFMTACRHIYEGLGGKRIQITYISWCGRSLLHTVLLLQGAWWRSWLRHCATNRKVAGSIFDGVIGIFNWHNPSCRTMALGSTQPLTEMSTRNISWGWRRPVRRADNLASFVCRLS
jgi:hypothetical protein